MQFSGLPRGLTSGKNLTGLVAAALYIASLLEGKKNSEGSSRSCQSY